MPCGWLSRTNRHTHKPQRTTTTEEDTEEKTEDYERGKVQKLTGALPISHDHDEMRRYKGKICPSSILISNCM